MDTPKRQVSWLESFPPDIWSYLSWYLPGEQLERLSMTGAALLRQRLTFPHVVKSIKLGEDFIIFKSLTRLFSDFPYVDELYIHSSTYKWSDVLGMTIDSIPLGLRKLELSGNWHKLAGELFGKYGTILKLNEHLPGLEVLDLSGLSCTSFTWMTHSPQSLTKLSLRHWNGSVELPTSLIHFEAYQDVTLSTSSFVSKLPPSLETFNVQDLKGVELLVPLLPTSTRKLCILRGMSCSNVPRTSWNLLEQLPKSLTCLQVPRTTEIKFETNPQLVSHLPSTLTELYIHSSKLPCSHWHLLPQQLTKLSIWADQFYSTVPSKTVDRHGVHHEVDSIPFDYFPRSITSLRMFGDKFFCGPPTTYDGSYFPPQLTHLDISSIQLSPETAKLLPSSLTFLVIRNLCEQVCQHLPNAVKTLVSSSTLFTPNLIKFLPESLTSLHLRVSLSDNIWYDYNNDHAIGSVEQHPQYPIQKDCVSRSFDWKNHPLPSTLTKLRIEDAYGLGDTFLQHQHLPNLTELGLWDSKHLTDLSIHHLPRHLTDLNLESSSNVSGKSFKFLPRGLIYLNLSKSESIFDCDIEHLPRTLKVANLKHAIHLSDICIPDLPPHMEWLNMEFNTQISTSCFPKLPYSLRSTQTGLSVEFANWEVHSGSLALRPLLPFRSCLIL